MKAGNIDGVTGGTLEISSVRATNKGVGAIKGHRAALRRQSIHVVLSIEGRLAKVEQAFKRFLDRVKYIQGHVDALKVGRVESQEKVEEEVKGEFEGAFNIAIGDLARKNEALEALVEAIRNEIIELKVKLARLKSMEAIGDLARKNEALEALVEAIRNEIVELKAKLARLKSIEGMCGIPYFRLNIPKPNNFKGSRDAKDVDNFL
ncbi:hypothetical protein PVK06_035358 [Gossypium arboreum]|uniref:Uncharacterized protein n=1 Tax=Gossypium arboreum TaxID=29729 RepID=A0ABR0NHS1_GOSAR|nr:hypothetical protein PVK06_035358 [Gossypium arboreum]